MGFLPARFACPCVVCAVLAGGTALGGAGQLATDVSDDFAIETRIFNGDDDRAAEHHLTVFTRDKIYDFRTHPDRSTIVFDRTTRRFQLARSVPPMQTSITADELIRFSASLQSKALQSRDPLIRFAAAPKFEQSYDEAADRLSLTSELWDYQVEGDQLEDLEQLKRYREFADWFTYLNAVFRPLPPGLRLELNRILAQHRIIPTQVTVTIRSQQETIRQRSEHRWVQPTGESERAAIAAWEKARPDLPVVAFQQFDAAGDNRRADKSSTQTR